MTSSAERASRSAIHALPLAALAAGLMWFAPAPVVQAQEFENRTIFTFDSPVQVPGAVLPPGRYVFQLIDPGQPARSVEIRKPDGGPALATTVTLPIRRPESEDASGVKVSFVGTRGDQPPAIKSWFYPGEETGHLFVYPEKQARQIAEATEQYVLASEEAEASGTVFLVGADGMRQQYSGEAQRAYLAGSDDRRAAGRADAEERLDRIARTVQTLLEGREVGTSGSPSEAVSISRDDLQAIQRHVEQLRRQLEQKR
ncbi:MAG TPA: hypothetical protein PKK95_08925 [Vicinamibacterales bacterium]|nr:hypothetical protein [Acidobacteriota bacterium]HOC18377.1 hypothetical protein [Vicinamibacterales bacterium]